MFIEARLVTAVASNAVVIRRTRSCRPRHERRWVVVDGRLTVGR